MHSSGAPETERDASPQESPVAAASTIPAVKSPQPSTPLPSPPAQLLGTLRYTADTLGCILCHLDTLGLAAASQTSRAHGFAIARYMNTMPSLFVHRGLDSGPAIAQLAALGLSLAQRHALRLHTVDMSPVEYPRDALIRTNTAPQIGSRGVIVNSLVHAGLTHLQRQLPGIALRNAATLRRIDVPGWAYSIDLLAAMVECSNLESLCVPIELGGDYTARLLCENILGSNRPCMTVLELRGIGLDAADAAFARLPLADVSLIHHGTDTPLFPSLGLCVTLRNLSLQFANIYSGGTNWRHCYSTLADTLPHLTRLESFKVDWHTSGENLADLDWRFAPSLRSIELGNTRRIPRMTGAGVRRFVTCWSTTLKLARIAADFPALEECKVRTLDRTSRRRHKHLLRAAFDRGLFRNLRRAQLCGVDDRTGNLILGGDTLLALARGCPLLEELDAHVHETFSIDHLSDMLERTPRLRVLYLSFSAKADEASLAASCVSRRPSESGLAATPIPLPDLEVLFVPVCTDDLVERLACPRLRRMAANGHAVTLRRLPAFPALSELSVQLDSDAAVDDPAAAATAAATALCISPTGVLFPAAVGRSQLAELCVAWAAPCSLRKPHLWVALRTFPALARLQVATPGSLEQVLDALASPLCPASALRQLVVKASPYAVFEFALESFPEAASLAAKHPMLQHVFCNNRALHAERLQKRLAAVGICLVAQGDDSHGAECREQACYAHLHCLSTSSSPLLSRPYASLVYP